MGSGKQFGGPVPANSDFRIPTSDLELIWVKLGGPPPVDPADLNFLALDTATPYVADYPGANGGQMAHYWARWVSSNGEKGPWSDTASATIGA